MSPEQTAWIQVYSSVLAALLSNPDCTMQWDDLRERATIEANVAVRAVYSRKPA